MTAKERNAHYGKLNARFDGRMKEIIELGFKRDQNRDGNTYVLKNVFHSKLEVCSATVMHADEIVWEDFINGVIQFTA